MKLLKIIASAIGILLLIAIIAVTLFVLLVDPNKFKPFISNKVQTYFNRQLKIAGNISWKIFPTLSLNIEDLELNNPASFRERKFAEIKNAIIGVKILPLLVFKMEPRSLNLEGLKLYLINTSDGKNNWEDLVGKQKLAVSDRRKRNSILSILSNIDISDGAVSWINAQTNQSIDLTNIEIHTKSFLLSRSLLFSITFNLIGKNPSLHGVLSLTTEILTNPITQKFSLNHFNLITQFWQEHQLYLYIQGNAVGNLKKETLQLNNIFIDFAGFPCKGQVKIDRMLSNPIATGRLEIQPFNARAWLNFLRGQKDPSLRHLKYVSGEYNFKTGTRFQSIDLQGKTKINNIEFLNMKYDNINIVTRLQNGILSLDPITADFYEGKINGNLKIDFNSFSPQVLLQQKITNLQTGLLMNDIMTSQKLKLKGVGNIDVKMTSSGTNVDTLLRNLNGTLQASFNNGSLLGLDLIHVMDSANALLSGKKGTSMDTGETQFGKLTATATINNGILTNTDLYMDAPLFETNGRGIVNLNTQQINYQLQARKKINENNQQGLQTPIPILINGSLMNPQVQLNVDSFMKSRLHS